MIKQAAIWFNGNVYTGKRHKDIVMDNRQVFQIYKGKKGFVTHDGIFVDRKEAAKIAYAHGQISEPKTELKSEDLY